MVDKRKGASASERTNTKKVKATTGAWWKSTIKKNEEKSKTSESEAVKEASQSEPRKVTRKRPPRKRSPRKKTGNLKKTDLKPGLAVEKSQQITPVVKTQSVSSQEKIEKKQEKATKVKSSARSQEQLPSEKLPKRASRPPRKRSLRKAWEKGKVALSPLSAILDKKETPPSVDTESKVTQQKSLDTTLKQEQQKAKDHPVKQEKKKAGTRKTDQRKKSRGASQDTVTPAEKDTPEREEEKDQDKPVIKLLINAEEPEESRLALLENGRLESLNVSTVNRAHTKNNIYKAKIVAIEPNLQAAFVDYGTDKNGFLPFNEIHPEYYKQNVTDKIQHFIDTHQWKKINILEVIEKGQEVLVQVVKEEVGKKGANMTTYLSLPGRCVVLMPGSDSTGISRKISGEERRGQLREIMQTMTIPEGIGWIVRTASIDITKTALSRDVNYLLRLWSEVKKKGQTLSGVGMVYQEQNSVLRFLREHFDPAIQEILVDDETALEQVREFVSLLPSKQRSVRVKLHRGSRPIFNQYSVEDQIESIYQSNVNLPSGGSIVIDPTEALVAIDVNSGSTSKGQNFEASIFQANMEAAKELARQLRLRDLGGLIVVDFIDMRSKKNIRDVEKQVKIAMKTDKAKVDYSRISKFGLMQISRQKLGAPIEAGNYRVCEHCKGRGTVRSVETLALFYLRRIQTGASRKVVKQVECQFPLDVAQYLQNNKRAELRELELKYNTEVIITADPALRPAENQIFFNKEEKDSDVKKQA